MGPGPTRAARGATAPHPQWCARRGPLAPFFAHSASLLRRGPCPCAVRSGAARPPPLSRPRSGLSAPPLRSAGAGPRAFPPALPLGLVRRCAAPAPLAGPAALGVALRPLRASCGRPCSAPCSPLRFAWPRRVPPCPSAVAASGPAASGPGACAGFARFLRPPAPGRLAARRACAACGASAAAAAVVGGFSPCLPPAPAPPAGGLRGARGLRPGGSRPRAARSPRGRGCFRCHSRRSPIVRPASRLPSGGAAPRP